MVRSTSSFSAKTWRAEAGSARSGLLLSVATAPEKHLARYCCERLFTVIRRFA